MGIDIRDLEAIRRFGGPWRGQDCMILGDCTFHVPGLDLVGFAKECGFRSASTIDIAGHPTFKVDLTKVPEDLQGRFGIVIDSGTLYCCLEVIAAWRGALSLLDATGGILHTAGLTGYFGRCYYSFSPRLFRDFYAECGFMITRMAVRATRSSDDRMIDIEVDDIFSVDSSSELIRFGPQFEGHIRVLPADAQIICEA